MNKDKAREIKYPFYNILKVYVYYFKTIKRDPPCAHHPRSTVGPLHMSLLYNVRIADLLQARRKSAPQEAAYQTSFQAAGVGSVARARMLNTRGVSL